MLFSLALYHIAPTLTAASTMLCKLLNTSYLYHQYYKISTVWKYIIKACLNVYNVSEHLEITWWYLETPTKAPVRFDEEEEKTKIPQNIKTSLGHAKWAKQKQLRPALKAHPYRLFYFCWKNAPSFILESSGQWHACTRLDSP